MPPANGFLKTDSRLLCYGEPKTRKTTWAVKTSLASGYNVIIFNADRGLGTQIMNLLTEDEKSRLHIINCSDAVNNPIFASVMVKLLRGQQIIWDDTEERVSSMRQNPLNAHYIIDPNKFTHQDVVIVDSYTKLVNSLQLDLAIQSNVEIENALQNNFSGYGWEGRMLNMLLGNQVLFQCNWIWIAHATLIEKTEDVAEHGTDGKIKIVKKILESKTHPISSSRAHSKRVVAEFNDVLWFEADQDGNMWVDTAKTTDRDGGCRNLAPGKYTILRNPPESTDLSYGHVVGKFIESPPTEFPAVTYVPAGEWLQYQAQIAAPTTIQVPTKPVENQLQINQ